jgi:hypothetical protein
MNAPRSNFETLYRVISSKTTALVKKQHPHTIGQQSQ